MDLKVERISAVTLKVSDMASSVKFYSLIPGASMVYGGAEASFTSFKIGENFLNLEKSADRGSQWGRLILYCDDVDAVNNRLKEEGLDPPEPRDASWGERFFHLKDPDGNEISFAKPITYDSKSESQ